jgi:hypothetical protein
MLYIEDMFSWGGDFSFRIGFNFKFYVSTKLFIFTYNDTVLPTMQLFLFFPFHNMFWPQLAIIRCLNLPELLWCIECHSFTSHVTAIFHDFKCCNHKPALVKLPYAVIYFLLKFIKKCLSQKFCKILRKSGGIAPPFLTSALDEGEWSASLPSCFTPGEIIPGTHWIGG